EVVLGELLGDVGSSEGIEVGLVDRDEGIDHRAVNELGHRMIPSFNPTATAARSEWTPSFWNRLFLCAPTVEDAIPSFSAIARTAMPVARHLRTSFSRGDS